MPVPWLVEIQGTRGIGLPDYFRLHVYDHETGKLTGRVEVPEDWAHELLAKGELTNALFQKLERPQA